MPTLFTVGHHRVVVYLNDHRPAHVHIAGNGYAIVALGNSPEHVRLIEKDGITANDLRRVVAEIIDRHEECLAGWRTIHGN
jgi:hypothetical protein